MADVTGKTVTGETQRGPGCLRAGRPAGAGLSGAAVGAAVAGIWHAAWAAAGGDCRSAGDAVCVPFVPVAAAVLGGGLVICAGVFASFLLLRVRPRRLTIPVGCILAAMLIWAIGVGIPGGIPPAPWTAALAAGAGLAALALSVDDGRAQVAGMIALPVVLIAAFTLPRLIHARTQESARERQLAALGFPLMVPVVAGYRVSGADAANGALSVSMTSDAPGGSALSSLPAFTVTITPATTSPAEPGPGGKPVKCGYLPPRPGCREVRPGLWLLPGGAGEVITWRGDLEVDALSLGYSPVSVSALVQAATDLRRATAAALAGSGS